MEPIRREIATRYLEQTSEATLTAGGTGTPWVPFLGPFAVELSGAWNATVTLQRSKDGGVTPLDVERYTANIQDVGDEPRQGTVWRLYIRPDEYISGAVQASISQ